METYDEDDANSGEGALGDASHCEAENGPGKPLGPSRTPVAIGEEEEDLLFNAHIIGEQTRYSKETTRTIANEQRSRGEGKSRHFIPTLAQSLSYAQIVKQQAKPTPQAFDIIKLDNIIFSQSWKITAESLEQKLHE